MPLVFISFPSAPVQCTTFASSAFYQRGIYLFATAWKLGSMTVTGIDSRLPRLLLFTPTVRNQVLCKCSDTVLTPFTIPRPHLKVLATQISKGSTKPLTSALTHSAIMLRGKKVRNGAYFIMFAFARQFLPALIASSSSVNIAQCVFIWTDATPLTVPLGTWLRD